MKISFLESTQKMRRQSGYSLIEVMAAVFVLAVMMVALFAGLASGFGIVNTTRQDLRATQILSQKMEAVRLLTWAQLTNCPTSFRESYDPTSTNGNGIVYYGTISTLGSATNIPNASTYYNQVHLITVSVLWTNYNYIGDRPVNPVPHFRQMKTLSAFNGIENYIYGYR